MTTSPTDLNISELTGLALDLAVARFQNIEIDDHGTPLWFEDGDGRTTEEPVQYHPSTSWAQGGPIIEREGLILEPGGKDGAWGAHGWLCKVTQWHVEEGPTPLIAAMRCYVAVQLMESKDD